MTVSSTANRIAYTGNGATTLFSFPYPFIAASDIQVYVAGVLKALTTDYTVSGTAPYPTGANITFVSGAPANLASIVIFRVRPYTQTLDLVENDPLPAEQVELDFDHVVMLAQQLNEAIGRSLVIPATDVTGTTVTLPSAAARANQALLFDASGNVTIGSTASATVSAAMVPVVQAITLALARAAFGATAIGESLFTAASAAAARTAISAQATGSYAASGANNDITSLSALTVPLIKTVKRQVFPSSGTYTPSTGMVYCDAEAWGAGGGGGGCSAVTNAVAGGGGAGGYSRKVFTAAAIGASQAVTIGAAGTAGSTAGGTGGTGGTSSLGSILSAGGGNGGVGNTSATVSVGGGLGGVGSLGDINATGAPGGSSITTNTSACRSGYGGNTSLGGGGLSTTNAVGNAGAANSGSGGSGGGSGGGTDAGGAGGTGYIVITEYCSQ